MHVYMHIYVGMYIYWSSQFIRPYSVSRIMKLLYPPDASTDAQQVVELVSGHPSSRLLPTCLLGEQHRYEIYKIHILKEINILELFDPLERVVDLNWQTWVYIRFIAYLNKLLIARNMGFIFCLFVIIVVEGNWKHMCPWP